MVVIVIVDGDRALLLGEVGCFGGEKLSCEVALRFVVCVAALSGLAELELCVGGLEALVVGWAAEGFFAASLGGLVWLDLDGG